ncbi:MAG: TetR/AcrR family transcriptional regulator C-terminal domain-containing protein [Kofleriaceae bacterium]
MSNLPIWAQPQPGARKPRFTREQIAEAALEIADKEGFAELSMRRVAESLGAGTMTLYYYIRTKDDLLALMDDALMAEVVRRSTPLPKHWRTALETIARAARMTFNHHPWAISQEMAGAMGGPNNLRHIEHSLEAVSSLPVPPQVKLEILSIVDDFVFGTVLRDRDTGAHRMTAEAAATVNDLTKHYLADGGYPHLTALIGPREPIDAFVDFANQVVEEGRFERGLAMILDGFTAKYGLAEKPSRRTAQRAHVSRAKRRRR